MRSSHATLFLAQGDTDLHRLAILEFHVRARTYSSKRIVCKIADDAPFLQLQEPESMYIECIYMLYKW